MGASMVGVVLESLLLKPAFSVRALFEAAQAVERALGRGDADAARESLRSLVSRETGTLSESEIAGAAIESLAENTNDSIIAPALAYVLFGLPGAYAYRAVNTMDAMLGYRGEYEWLGKAAARLDDVVNLVPARVTAILLVLASVMRGSGRAALRAAVRDHARTASPNAGWPMSAMSGAIGVRLTKQGAYTLGSDYPEPRAGDIHAALDLIPVACCVGLCTPAALRVVMKWSAGSSRHEAAQRAWREPGA
jgi:adenosylcobinamide-phosphate synthase